MKQTNKQTLRPFQRLAVERVVRRQTLIELINTLHERIVLQRNLWFLPVFTGSSVRSTLSRSVLVAVCFVLSIKRSFLSLYFMHTSFPLWREEDSDFFNFTSFRAGGIAFLLPRKVPHALVLSASSWYSFMLCP